MIMTGCVSGPYRSKITAPTQNWDTPSGKEAEAYMIFLPMHLRVRKIVASMRVERRNQATVNAAAHFYGCTAHAVVALAFSCIRL